MMTEKNKKILIVSHNVIDNTSGMGKTLGAYFKWFGSANIAQFYIHPDVPIDFSICQHYYRFTDIDAIKARLPFINTGKEYSLKCDCHTYEKGSEKVPVESVYQYGRKRTGLIYLGREVIWKTAFWNSRDFRKWIRDFSPDLVFFASGDYAFMYDIAVTIADIAKCPLIVSCMDDYYTNNINADTSLGRLFHSYFMKVVNNTMQRSSRIFCMCDQMRDLYSEMFNRPAETLYTPAETNADLYTEDKRAKKISYIGRLGVGRYKSLIDIGRTLHGLKIPGGPDHIDVYAYEKRHDVIEMLNNAEGIVFHGAVPANQVEEIMQESIMVIHAESFEDRFKGKVRYSISTKIAESLVNGPCILAYGPDEIASIDYLKKNGAAIVATDEKQLVYALSEGIQNDALRKRCIQNARALGAENHSPEAIHKQLNSAFSIL